MTEPKVVRKIGLSMENSWGHIVFEGLPIEEMIDLSKEPDIKEWQERYTEEYGEQCGKVDLDSIMDMLVEEEGANGICLDAVLMSDGSIRVTGISRKANGEIETFEH